MNLVNKRMIITINKLAIELTGGQSFSGSNNMIAGSSLGFVDRIKVNKVFGKPEFGKLEDGEYRRIDNSSKKINKNI